MLEVMKMDEIKFTSSSVWEKREDPGKYWNGTEWNVLFAEVEEKKTESWFIQKWNKLDCAETLNIFQDKEPGELSQ